jgi:3-hydroxyisobutyrate dehydrogenase-like beta-hydroxyacid dehydrogenase
MFACVSDPAAARDLVLGEDGLVKYFNKEKAFIDMSTVDEHTVKDINAAITQTGGRYMEAPVSGSKVPAEQGTLLILCGGEKALFDECKSCFDAMGKEAYYLGDVGQGARMKLVVNAVMGAHMAALSEGIQLAKKSNLDCDVLHDVLCKGALSSPLVQGKGKALLSENFATNFPLKHQQKDLRLALQLSEEVHQQIPVISAANELYKTAVAKQHGDDDMCAVYNVLKN